MAIWDNFFRRRDAEPASAKALLERILKMPPSEVRNAMTSLDVFRELYAGVESSSGQAVNWRVALEATTALACARVIADGMAQIPFRLMRASGGKREPARNHPVFRLLEYGPNEFQTTTEFFDMLGLHVVFVGNFFVFLLRNPRGEIIEMLPLLPEWVTVDLDTDTWARTYKVTFPNKAQRVVPARDIWHVRGPSWNGWMGLEGVKLAREAIGLSISQEKTAGSLQKNGTRMPGFLTTEMPLDKKQRDELRQSWQESFGGAENAGKVGVMSNGMKFMSMGQTMNDAQFLEQRKFQVEEVCRAFRVMPIMVGYSDKNSTYASAEQMFLAHVVHTMGPWYRRVESSANAALLTPAERDQGHYTKFFTQALLRGAAQDRAEFYTKLYGIGAINPNEIRDFEDMNPYDGGERYAVPLNMISPKLADEVQTAKADSESTERTPQPMSGATQGPNP